MEKTEIVQNELNVQAALGTTTLEVILKHLQVMKDIAKRGTCVYKAQYIVDKNDCARIEVTTTDVEKVTIYIGNNPVIYVNDNTLLSEISFSKEEAKQKVIKQLQQLLEKEKE